MSMRLLGVALMAAICADARAAGGGRPLREAQSADGRFELRVKAGKRDAACSAALFDRSGDGERKRWERPLFNEAAPVHAVIRDDGRFVVTLDEYRRGGARNALLVYGEHGQLLRHFLLTDLLGREDWAHVRKSRRSLEWLDGAEFAFRDGPEIFEVRLKWGALVQIDLKTLRVLRETDAAEDVPAEILSELSGAGPPVIDEHGDVIARAEVGGFGLQIKVSADLSPEQRREMIASAIASIHEHMPGDLSAEQEAEIARQLDEELASVAEAEEAEEEAEDAEEESDEGEEELDKVEEEPASVRRSGVLRRVSEVSRCAVHTSSPMPLSPAQ